MVSPSKSGAPSRLALLLAFFVIYVVWGSTYLAIRYAVETIPSLLVVGVRQGVAGLAIFAWAYARGYRPTWREWKASLVLGTLYFAIGHGTLHWAETVVPSGLAAVLLLLASLLSGEIGRAHLASFSARSIGALVYLIVFGTIIAFTTYTWLL